MALKLVFLENAKRRVFAFFTLSPLFANRVTIVLRFVKKERSVREGFVGFYKCDNGVTGQAIATLIMKGIHEVGLSMDNSKGHCYDSAGNMSGRCNGAGAIVRRQYPKAIYTNCMAHYLKLCCECVQDAECLKYV